MRLHAAVAMLAVALPLAVMAGGYDKTTWGMSLAQVQKLYPGGVKEVTPTGDLYYSIQRKVVTLDAVVSFAFGEGRLQLVMLRFPQPGTGMVKKPNGKVGYMRPTGGAADNIVTILQSSLRTKYGEPEWSAEKLKAMGAPPATGNILASWMTDNGETQIILTMKAEPDGERVDVGLGYGISDAKTSATEKTRGL